MTGSIHSFETFGAADGPGVRFIVFLHGCPFRCSYCHNPDTWAAPPAMECTAAEVLAKALRYSDYWGSEGGITLSGGEPMMQARFGAELFEMAHAEGVTTCLDTAAGVFDRNDDGIVRLIEESDTVLLDLKVFDPSLHRKITRADNARVLDCARFLAERGKRVWIRRVLVPGLTDGEDDLLRTGGFIRSLGNVERVEVLAYHDFGVAKWNALGLDYELKGIEIPAEDEIERARSLLANSSGVLAIDG